MCFVDIDEPNISIRDTWAEHSKRNIQESQSKLLLLLFIFVIIVVDLIVVAFAVVIVAVDIEDPNISIPDTWAEHSSRNI